MQSKKQIREKVKEKGYVPGTLITKINAVKEKRASQSPDKKTLTKKDVAIRGLI